MFCISYYLLKTTFTILCNNDLIPLLSTGASGGGGGREACSLNKICPPLAGGLARHNKRLTIKEIIHVCVATRCQILRLKCTKSFVGWGSAPDPAGGAYSAPQTPYSWILGGLLLRGRGRDERGRGGGEGRGRRGKEAAGSAPS